MVLNMMTMFPEYIPEHDHEFSFENKVNVSFGYGTLIDFYDEDDTLLFSLDPSDLSVIYAAYRAMVREKLEEDGWSNKEIL